MRYEATQRRRLAGVGDSWHGNHFAFGEAWTAGTAREISRQHAPVLAALLERHVHDFERHVLRPRVAHERRGLQVSQADLQPQRSEEHTSELQSRQYLVCRLLLEKKK